MKKINESKVESQSNVSGQKPLKKISKKQVSPEVQQRLDNMRRPHKASKVCSPRAADKKPTQVGYAPKPAPQPSRKGSSAGKNKEPDLPFDAKVQKLLEEGGYLAQDEGLNQTLLVRQPGNPIARPVDSQDMVNQLYVELMERGEDVSPEAVEKALVVLKTKVKHFGNKVRVYCAVGYGEHRLKRIIDLRHDDGALAVLEGGQVHIVREGEKVVMLRRPGMAAFPMPAETSDPELDGLNPLLDLINAPEEEKYLLLAWMAFVLSHPLDPMVSQVFLVLLGGQGSGKSSFCKWVLRKFVDPSKMSVMALPRNIDDLAVATSYTYMPIIDNVRNLSRPISDRLCKMSTGGEVLKRKLYTDADPHVSTLQTSLVLNGIVNPVTEPDLSSRCLFVHLEALDADQRVSEAEMADYLTEHEGGIFRALLELAAQALNVMEHVEPQRPLRMLEFSRWLAACEHVMGLDGGYLEDAYANNQASAYESSIGEQPLANALYNFALLYCVDGPWVGTCSELLPLLEELVSDRDIRAHFHQWPHNPESLGRRFTQHAASLDALGVKLERLPRSRNRQVKISLKADCPRLAELAQD
ncbi:hypothetical protein LWH48_17765 [Halomonas sp. G15]|uniref:hypothetical protein n=1 Tax=Halomonas sp. G15 TaxID=2903521 RepID=UPI001E58BD1A|nr:hypothetical protein [Halomonas sp. G15]MCE0734607.1 hypothetical protein [Halomonas sp. G15]